MILLILFSLSVEQEEEEGGKLHSLQRLCTHLAPQREPRYEPYNNPIITNQLLFLLLLCYVEMMC